MFKLPKTRTFEMTKIDFSYRRNDEEKQKPNLYYASKPNQGSIGK